ncbi:MAG: right-handed parallel beta-helix repeat-containing protein [Kofleriaceae bacterium]
MRWLFVFLIACGGHGDDDQTTPGDSAGVIDAGPVSSCDPPGHFGGAPALTFTLPANGNTLAYDDVQAKFPNVDWKNLDRLYLPAGVYTQIMLGNLPDRSADRPLIITNLGGQVQIGPAPTANYIWSFTGGSNWILTGRYDPMSQTGDVNFPGHACGAYAESKYGIVSDDAFAFSAPYLHMGLGVGNASDFEIEYVEVKRSGFAGIRLLNQYDQVVRVMANVKVHDTYVHDTGGEGYYFGWTGNPPSNLLPGLQIYNNRLLRTGNEALQIQDLGDGSHIYNNTIVAGGLHWLDNGLGRYQDNNSQILTRQGQIEIDHNIFVDGAGTLVNFFSSPETNDGPRQVTFHDNYFANTIDLGLYLNGTSDASSSFTFANNQFRGAVFAYTPIDSAATDPKVLFGINNAMAAPIAFSNNTWEGTDKLVNAGANITTTNNTNGPVTELPFQYQSAGHHLTAWVATVTVSDPDHPAVFHQGDVVSYGDAPDFYMATGATTSADVPGTAAVWMKLAAPADDLRTNTGQGVQ